MGETTLAMAAADPARDVIAVDVHTPGAGALIRDLEAGGVSNVRVVVADALVVLGDMLAPGSLDEVRVFFPDPWPKLRHHKRRLVNGDFARLVATRLRPGGVLHVATDWTPYAQQTLAVVAAEPALQNRFDGYAPRPAGRPVTRFERQGLAKGHPIHDVVAQRVTQS
jgi:tRNA (guanine-N7-)-methyltransferase